MAEWLRTDVPGEIDYLAFAAQITQDDPKRALIALRPQLLHALFDTGQRRLLSGCSGRLVVWLVADLGEPVGRTLLSELPVDVANAAFWANGTVPVVIRAGIGGDAAARRQFLSVVRDQYFGQIDFSKPYYGNHVDGQLYGNEFDSTLLCSEGELRTIVEHLVPLQIAENQFARSHLQRHSPGGIMVIENVMSNSLRWRKVDWLSVTAYPYFRRLWDAKDRDILDLLDYRRCPGRAADPWAALKGHEREKNWENLGLDEARFDLMRAEEAYRISPGDHRTRLHLARFLLRHRLYQDVLKHCELGRREAGPQAADQWLKVEGFALHGLGRKEDGLLRIHRYRQGLEADASPSAAVLDEIASLALMDRDFAKAFDFARRAVEKDRFLAHAYDTMVVAGRGSGNAEYERTAAELAASNGVTVPIHVREKTSAVLKSAEIVKPQPARPPSPKPWWQFWK